MLKKTRLIPLGHRVLIKVDMTSNLGSDEVWDGENVTTKTGIIIAYDTDKDKETKGARKGTVVDIGNTAFDIYGKTPWVKVGDIVFFKRYEGEHFRIEKDDFIVLDDEHLICKLEEK